MTTFTGTSASEIFTGGPEADSISGGGGADTLSGGDSGDVIYSGGFVPAFRLPYSNLDYTLPQLDTGSEVDSLLGGNGDDVLFAGYGDHIDGGAGHDVVFISFRAAPSGVTADFTNFANQTIGGGVIVGVEGALYMEGSEYGDRLSFGSVSGGGWGSPSASGRGGNDTITAGYNTGSIFGDDGDDVLDGRPSPYLSRIEGGNGNDTVHGGTSGSGNVSGGAGNDTLHVYGVAHGDAGNDVIYMRGSSSSPAYGDDGDDQIIGSNGSTPTTISTPNVLVGGAGADTLTGAAGDDFLYSGDYDANSRQAVDDMGLERDSLSGSGGNDTIAIGYGDNADGGAGTDTLRLSLGGATSGVDFNSAGIISGAPFTVGGGLIQNIETLLYLRGSEFADTLWLATHPQRLIIDAGGGDDVISSQASTVAVSGGAGNDRFVSGAAADSFDGGAGFDTVDYSGSASAVTVNLRTGAGGAGDTLTSVEAVVGSGFDDTLIGSANGSTLSGGAGVDRFEVGLRDVVNSGAGADLIYVTLGTHSAASQAAAVTINDFATGDRLQFGTITGAYTELTAGSFAAASTAADAQAAAGYNFVSVQVGSDVFVFGNAVSGRQHFDDAVRLVGANLDAVSASNIGLPGALEPAVTPTPVTPTTPPVTPTTPTTPPVTPTTPTTPSTAPVVTLPAAAPFVLTGSNGQFAGDMSRAHLAPLLEAEIIDESDTVVNARDGNGLVFHMEGSGFSTATQWNSGIVTQIGYTADAAHGGPLAIFMTVPSISLGVLADMASRDATFEFFAMIFAGNDRIVGGVTPQLWTFGGDDLIYTNANTDTVWAGAGNDVIDARAPGPTVHSHYLRGEDGDDYVLGGNGFDDINGNKGRDTASGGNGDDWVVGGQDEDLLFGDNGFDIVYGNLGNDTVSGGNGNDWVRGGQGDDLLLGGTGNDFMSGDRGNDTIYGGTGADQFNLVSGAAVDRVMDFSAAEGDFVTIEGGLAYTLSFVGGDAVIDIGNGDRMTLAGISNSSLLGANWLH